MALGLNIVVGFAGLLDLGYVAFFAIGAFVMGWLGSQQFPDVDGGKGIHILTPAKSAFGSARPGHPHQLLLRHLHRGDLHRDMGRHPRRPDAAPARRLPGHRDAGLRRDRPAHLRELDERHLRHRQHRLLQRAPGDHADRQGQPPLDRREVQISARAQTDLLRRPGDGRCWSSSSTAACATRAWGARGSPCARTRWPPRPWASTSCAPSCGPTRWAPRWAGSRASSWPPTTTRSTSTSSSSASRC